MTTITLGAQKHRWSAKGDDPAACSKCNVMRRTVTRARRTTTGQGRKGDPMSAVEYSKDGGKTWSETFAECPEWWGGPGRCYVDGVLVEVP